MSSTYSMKKSDATLMLDYKDINRLLINITCNGHWAEIYLNEKEAKHLSNNLIRMINDLEQLKNNRKQLLSLIKLSKKVSLVKRILNFFGIRGRDI